MASRLAIARPSTLYRALQLPHTSTRSFQTTRPRLQDAVAVRRPVGAFRGGLFGFLLGSTVAGATAYYYVIDEYKVANDLLTEDIWGLQASVHRIHDHVTELENKLAQKDNAK